MYIETFFQLVVNRNFWYQDKFHQVCHVEDKTVKSIQTVSCPLIRFPIIALCILSLSLVGCSSDDDNAIGALACILLLPICMLAGKSASQPGDSEFVSMPDNLRVDYDDSNIDGPTFHLSWDMPPEKRR